jgi:SNF2 family DNA or RNA helicase
MWPHQEAEIARLVAGHRLLAWQPGTGKTNAALAAFGQIPVRTRMLVIVPASTRYQWAFAAERFAFKTQIIENTTTTVDPAAEIVIMSYHGVIAPKVWKSAMALDWDVLTLDESHYTKSPSAKWTKAIFGARKNSPACLFKKAKRIWMLTGTPIVNDPGDLWVMVSRVFPHLLEPIEVSNRQQWVQQFCTGYDTPYGFKVTGARNVKLLKSMLQPYMSVVDKKTVLSNLKEPLIDQHRLPPRKIKMDPSLDPVLQKVMAMFDQDDLNELETDPQIATLRRLIGMEKAKESVDFIKEELISHDKVIVFFAHTDVGRTISEGLKEFEPVIYDGKQTPVQKQRNKERFINDPKCRVILVQNVAGGTGVDGLQIAQRVVIVEDPWTHALKDQIVSRAHRGGQQGQVHCTSIVLTGSFDEKVVKIIERKARITEQVIAA